MAGTGVSGLEECMVADSGLGELDDVCANEGRGLGVWTLRHGFGFDDDFVLVVLRYTRHYFCAARFSRGPSMV